MSRPQPPKRAKLVIGLLLKDKALYDEVAAQLEKLFGPLDMASAWMDFDFTDYYADEMGKPLHRRILSFSRLIEQQDLGKIKRLTNELEKSFAIAGNRRLNIDPGYLLHERFVLATGKNYAHRIYVGHMIYADLTLIFQKGAYQTLPWTYPDYGDQRTIAFLMRVRAQYGSDLQLNPNQ